MDYEVTGNVHEESFKGLLSVASLSVKCVINYKKKMFCDTYVAIII